MAYRYEMPIGFGMALTMNEAAMKTFSNLTENEKQSILAKARSAASRDEMVALVDSLSSGTAAM